nr:hypothetical protein [Nitrosomonas nitrosa]
MSDAIKTERAARQREREELLDRLSLATLRQITKAMEGDDKVTAAAINVARQVLSDNGITVEALRQKLGNRLGMLGRELPSFPDEQPPQDEQQPFAPLSPEGEP